MVGELSSHSGVGMLNSEKCVIFTLRGNLFSIVVFGDFPGGAVVKNRLPMQGTWVRALVREDPICHGATKPVSHNY